MTSSSTSRRLGLLALLAGVLGAGSSATLATTSATFSAEATGAAHVGVAPACTGDVTAYTSGLLDAAGPLLRWSFSTAPVVGTTATSASSTPTGEGAEPATATGTDPVGGPTAEPTAEPAAEPLAEPAAGPTAQPAADPTAQPEAGPGPDRTAEPAVEPSADATATPTAEPVVEPAAEPAAEPATEPATEPGVEPGVEPAEPAAEVEPAPTTSPPTPAPAAPPVPATGGLLVCDPVDLAAGGAADPAALRSLDLPGGPGSGLTSDAPVTGAGPFTLLLWVHVPAGAPDGDLVSMRAPGASADLVDDTALVLSVTGGALHVAERRTGTTTPVTAAALGRGATHLVTAVLAGDGATRTLSLAVDDAPATAPVPLTVPVADARLTLGADGDATSTVARVDEVTIVPGALTDADRAALVTADRWWVRSAS